MRLVSGTAIRTRAAPRSIFRVLYVFRSVPSAIPFRLRCGDLYLHLVELSGLRGGRALLDIPYSFPFRVENLYLKPRPSVEEPRICDPPHFSSQFPSA